MSLETERTEIMTQTKIYEERLIKISNDSKAQKSLEEGYKNQIKELMIQHENEINELHDKNNDLVECMQQKEQDYFNSNNELLKLNALLEQKIEMIEEDLKD